jgi:hypothetical protein
LAVLVDVVQSHIDGIFLPPRRVRIAVTALAYLRDPFDALFDQHRHLGLEDDCRVIRSAASALATARSDS